MADTLLSILQVFFKLNNLTVIGGRIYTGFQYYKFSLNNIR